MASHGRLLMTAYGWNDSGGGTAVPRAAAKELARRGWDVTVFHAAVGPAPGGVPYDTREWTEDGVRLIGVHNRPHGLFDLGHPLRELDDPPITAAFAAALDRLEPDVVHFHNLHNLGAALIDEAAARGLPSYFSTHNYWLICPRAYLMTADGAICPGPGDGARCASCTGGTDVDGHRHRLGQIRARAARGLTACLAVSHAVRRTLLAAGYPAELVDVVRQGMPQDGEIWERLGRDRRPGRAGERLTVAFLGSAYAHKGPQLLIEAAQRTRAELRVEIHGEVPARFAEQLRALDRRGVVALRGAFGPGDIARVLADVDVAALPSRWWDCAPLAAAECLAARVPLVVPRLGGLAEAVRDGVDGLVFDALGADDLARTLDRLAEEPGLLEQLQAGIEPPHAFTAYVDDLEAYYGGERPGRVAGGAAAAPPAHADEPAPTAIAAGATPTGGAPSPQPAAPASQPTAPASLAIRWQGDHGLPSSLSIVNDQVTARLPGRVQRIARDGRPVAPGALPHAADVEVRHQWPPDLSPAPAGRLAVIAPWEFGAVPRDWVAPLREHVDELWVPSEYVRAMYLDAGVDPARVVAIPNGVDLATFSPGGPRRALDVGDGPRFLFVGGLIWRKGPDLLLDAWRAAFAGREDVTLVVKDFGADGVYRGGDREALRAHAASGALPRVILIDEVLEPAELAALYRACDVLVHPYRGEGFAMPVLEAMACGLPAIVTGGGPTDEFCPPAAGWRIRAARAMLDEHRVGPLETAGRPWVLAPDPEHLAELLTAAAADADERARRGAAARAAAERYGWDAVAARYADRIAALAAGPPRIADPAAAAPRQLDEPVALRVLATPAWRGADRLGVLLAQWCAATTRATSACLYLLADPRVDGRPDELEQRVMAAASAAGADLDDAADINVLMEAPTPDRDARLHAAIDVYVPLHAACAGHERLARAAGNAIVAPGAATLATRLRAAAIATPA